MTFSEACLKLPPEGGSIKRLTWAEGHKVISNDEKGTIIVKPDGTSIDIFYISLEDFAADDWEVVNF